MRYFKIPAPTPFIGSDRRQGSHNGWKRMEPSIHQSRTTYSFQDRNIAPTGGFTNDGISLVLGLLDVDLRKTLNPSVHKIATTDATELVQWLESHSGVNLRSLMILR